MTMNKSFQPTIRDIAREAKVSIATVSRYLNMPEKVRKETGERIQRIIDKHNYRCNFAAKALATQRTKTIGYIIPAVNNQIYSECARGVQDEAQLHGYQVFIASAEYNRQREKQMVENFLERRVDGIILTVSDSMGDIAQKLFQEKIPAVNLFNKQGCLPCVSVDNVKASYDATEYLIKLGHRSFAMLGVPFTASDRCRMRYEGFLHCLQDHDIPTHPQSFVQISSNTLDCSEGVEKLMNSSNPPTAIFASNDLVAINTISALRRLGFEIPKDISVIGFDDIPMAKHVWPPLTTVLQPGYRMGRQAASVLLDILRTGKHPEETIPSVQHDLIIRESSGVPPR